MKKKSPLNVKLRLLRGVRKETLLRKYVLIDERLNEGEISLIFHLSTLIFSFL